MNAESCQINCYCIIKVEHNKKRTSNEAPNKFNRIDRQLREINLRIFISK